MENFGKYLIIKSELLTHDGKYIHIYIYIQSVGLQMHQLQRNLVIRNIFININVSDPNTKDKSKGRWSLTLSSLDIASWTRSSWFSYSAPSIVHMLITTNVTHIISNTLIKFRIWAHWSHVLPLVIMKHSMKNCLQL